MAKQTIKAQVCKDEFNFLKAIQDGSGVKVPLSGYPFMIHKDNVDHEQYQLIGTKFPCVLYDIEIEFICGDDSVMAMGGSTQPYLSYCVVFLYFPKDVQVGGKHGFRVLK